MIINPIADGSTPLPNMRQEAFCQAMTSCPPMSATAAYVRAGYTDKNAASLASRLLATAVISRRLAYLRQVNAKTCQFTKAQALAILSEIVRGTSHTEAGGRVIVPTVRDRIRAADSLARLCGWYGPEKVDVVEPKVVFNWSFDRPPTTHKAATPPAAQGK